MGASCSYDLSCVPMDIASVRWQQREICSSGQISISLSLFCEQETVAGLRSWLFVQICKSAGSGKAAGAWALSLLLLMVSVNRYEQDSLLPKSWFVLRTDVMFSNITSCI